MSKYDPYTLQQVWSGEYEPAIPWSLICAIWFIDSYWVTTLALRYFE